MYTLADVRGRAAGLLRCHLDAAVAGDRRAARTVARLAGILARAIPERPATVDLSEGIPASRAEESRRLKRPRAA